MPFKPANYQQQCGLLFPQRDAVSPVDESGCVLPSSHHGPHEFIATDGKRYWWETDLDCDCETCQTDDPDDWCIVYAQVKRISVEDL